MKQDKYCYPWAVPVSTYITDKHNGITSRFARSQNVRESQARRWLKRNCVVIGGVVYCEVSKQTKKDDNKD
jgi:hypothetical protein